MNMQVIFDKLNSLIEMTYYGNNVIEWGICFIGIIFSYAISKLFFLIISYYGKKFIKKAKINAGNKLIDVIEKPFVYILTVLFIKYSLSVVTLSKTLSELNSHIFSILISIILGFGLYKLFNVFADIILLPLCEKSETEVDDQILIIARKCINITIIIGTILFIIQSAGKDINTLLAGLGLGGLAFALAAQETIANIFGGLTIIVDKPFKIGDRVQVDHHDGYIIDIGFRSTRIKTFIEEKIISIPNSIFANKAIKNMSTCFARHKQLSLALIYSTTEEQMQLAINLLKDIIEKNDKIENKNIVFFKTFNDFSLDIEVNYYIKHSVNEFETQSEINLEILKTFNKNNLEFAYPTQTLYAQIEKK